MLQFNPPPVVARQVAVPGVQISAVNGTAFVNNMAAFTANNPTYWKLLASGSVTQANSKISAVAGTAFYDFGSGTNLTANLGKYLIVKDSTGKAIKGWIKAAGSGETLGADLSTGSWANSSIGDRAFTTLTVSGKTITEAAGSGRCGIQVASMPNNGVLYVDKSITLNSGTLPASLNCATSHALGYGTFINNTTTGQFIASGTDTTYISLIASAICNFSLVLNSVKQVLTPSSTGCTITSTKNGTTFNWESQEAGFNYNDASGYTYFVYDRDLSAFCDNGHSISIYSNNGSCIEGVMKEPGTVETYGADLLAGWDFTSGWTPVGAITITDSNTLTVSGGPGFVVTNSNIFSSLGLYKKITDWTTSSPELREQVSGSPPEYVFSYTDGEKIFTAPPGLSNYALRFRASNTGVSDFTQIEIYQITAPSASGAVIVNQKGGSTQNFRRVDAGFVYNAASYDIIIRKLR